MSLFFADLTVLPQLKSPDYPAIIQVLLDEKIPMVETAGSPKCAELWAMLKAGNSDVCIIHKCTTIRHALKAQGMGCDMISLDGFDCAGHPGETDVGNFVLQPVAARKLNIPFVTSGGVGDGKQLAASLALGAEGVNMGTRFMATLEAPIHANIKQALVDGDENSTQLVMRTLKNTERVYKNRTSDEVLRIEAEHPGEIEKIIHLVRGDVCPSCTHRSSCARYPPARTLHALHTLHTHTTRTQHTKPARLHDAASADRPPRHMVAELPRILPRNRGHRLERMVVRARDGGD